MLLIAAVAIVASGPGRPNPASGASHAAPASPLAAPSHTPTLTGIPLETVDEACVKEVGPFVASLETLSAGVGPSVTFGDYSKLIADSRTARGQVRIAQLDPACIALFASARTVLGEYVEAYSAWNDCITTTGCTRPAVEATLVGHWASARTKLARVTGSLP